MLVLTRRPDQSILVGRDIVITVLEVRGDQVRVGISAPAEIAIRREELVIELDATVEFEALVKDGEAPDAGVEDGNRKRAIGARHGRNGGRRGGMRPRTAPSSPPP